MAIATTIVALLPAGIVWLARAEGVVSAAWLCVAITVLVSLCASLVGSWYWKRRPRSGDILFSELLLWGWLRRLRIERQLDRATQALGLADGSTAASEDSTTERQLELLTQLAAATEARDPYVAGHSRRVARYATGVARKLGLSPEQVSKVASAAAVHDVGKLRLPREVLMKPGALTDEEFEIVKRHSDEGAEMVDCLGDPELTAIVRHHHERLDGSGYPAGLSGDEIPLGARIIAVVDTFDAITSARPYRPASRHKQALDTIVRESGSQLDAAAVRAFVSYYSGKRVFALWTLVAAAPQRAFAGARRGAVAQSSTSAGPAAGLVTGAATTALMGVAAVIAPVAVVQMGHAGGHRWPAAEVVSGAPVITAARTARQPVSVDHRVSVVRLGRQFAVRPRAPGSAAVTPRFRASTLTKAPAAWSLGTRPAPRVNHGNPAASPRLRPPQPPTSRGRPAPGPGSGGPSGGKTPVTPGGTNGASSPSGTSSTPTDPVSGSTGSSTGTTGPGGGAGGGGGGTGGGGGGGTGGGGGGGTGGGTLPRTLAQCLQGGWLQFGIFKNQGQCVAYVRHNSSSP